MNQKFLDYGILRVVGVDYELVECDASKIDFCNNSAKEFINPPGVKKIINVFIENNKISEISIISTKLQKGRIK